MHCKSCISFNSSYDHPPSGDDSGDDNDLLEDPSAIPAVSFKDAIMIPVSTEDIIIIPVSAKDAIMIPVSTEDSIMIPVSIINHYNDSCRV